MEERMLREKYEHLAAIVRGLGSVAVAFSGGVDSTFLLKVAHDVLEERALAITATSSFFPRRETDEASAFCEEEGIRQLLCPSGVLGVKDIRRNPRNRCYLCKRALFEKLCAMAKENHLAHVAEGSNMDDNGDYRPGMQAIAELGIRSPLREAGLWKQDIRELSREMGLPTWDKPSFACLASRFPYGEEISKEKLYMVERAEQFLLERGFRQIRVRIHGKMARIEALPEDFGRFLQGEFREEILKKFREVGFQYVSMDLQGYRTGSMNEVLQHDISAEI